MTDLIDEVFSTLYVVLLHDPFLIGTKPNIPLALLALGVLLKGIPHQPT